MQAIVTWEGKLTFKGTSDSGYTLPIGTLREVGGDEDGFRPMELILIGLAGCTALDVISILKKKKQDVHNFEVRAIAERSDEHPKVMTHVLVEYIITGPGVSREAVDRAIELSETRYCPAHAMLSQVVPIEKRVILINE